MKHESHDWFLQDPDDLEPSYMCDTCLACTCCMPTESAIPCPGKDEAYL